MLNLHHLKQLHEKLQCSLIKLIVLQLNGNDLPGDDGKGLENGWLAGKLQSRSPDEKMCTIVLEVSMP